MNKLFIKNRHDKKLSVIVDEAENQTGLAFVAHGLGGTKEQPLTTALAEAFVENGIITVRYDAANTFGESEGRYEDATTTNYSEDLEDVIGWAKTQQWYQEPFWLCGHSLGSFCTLLYAEKHPSVIAGIAPISTVVSGPLSLESKSKDELVPWKKTGWRISERASSPGNFKKLPWSHIEDRMQYDVLPEAHQLTMPTFLLVGENDTTSTPVAHQKILFEAIPEPKEFHIIPDAPHTFMEPKHIAEVKKLLSSWIKEHIS